MKRGRGVEIYFRDGMVRFGHELGIRSKENSGMTQVPDNGTR